MSSTLDSLRGLAVGDALGAQFFVPANRPHLDNRTTPPPPWAWTDDTEMACSVYAVLAAHGTIDQDALARAFAGHHDFDRGYGPATNRMLRLVREGGDWRTLAADLFDGRGSWGNGAAMRVAPLGAFFAGDPARAAAEAARSATVTHTHPEAVAGAIAVAVAAALPPAPPAAYLRTILPYVPPGTVHAGIAEAITLLGHPAPDVALVLGNGRLVSAADTVPFALWCAATHREDYAAAFWATASAGGDIDTTCAIVGGIVTGPPPPAWLAACEPLPPWTPKVPA